MKTYLNIFFLFLILCASCGSRKANDNKETTLQADTVKKFTLPIIPAMLNTPELRADYLVRHYWILPIPLILTCRMLRNRRGWTL